MARNLGTRHRFYLFRLPAMLSLGLLAGCALPLPVQIASWALDGISLMTTHKSIADHGLSLIARRDCAIWRGFVGEPVCITDDAGVLAVASLSPAADVNTVAADHKDVVAPVIVANPVPTVSTPITKAIGADHYSAPRDAGTGIVSYNDDSGKIKPSALALAPAPAPSDKNAKINMSISTPTVNPKPPAAKISPPPATAEKTRSIVWISYVIGRFSRVSRAKRMAGRYARLAPEVMKAKDGNKRVFKVMVGPFASTRQDEVRGNILRSGINNIRVADMDGSELFIARYYSIAADTAKTSTPKTVGKTHPDTAKVASFTRYKRALLNFLGV